MEINTKNGLYKYESVELYYGRKFMDLQGAKDNLLDFKELLDSNQVPFGIIYGTLLGAIRENNFITYDEDIDVFMLDEYREELLSCLFDFRKIGFEVARYDNNLLSLIRNNDYIDIYFFKKHILGNRVCSSDSIQAKYLESFDVTKFLGVEFNTPKDPISFLEKAYGKDWKIPRKNSPAEVKGSIFKIKLALKKYLPGVVLNSFRVIKKYLQIK